MTKAKRKPFVCGQKPLGKNEKLKRIVYVKARGVDGKVTSWRWLAPRLSEYQKKGRAYKKGYEQGKKDERKDIRDMMERLNSYHNSYRFTNKCSCSYCKLHRKVLKELSK